MEAIEKKKKKENLLVSLLCIVTPLLIIGIWMLLTPAAPQRLAIEEGAVYFIKSVWGPPAGLTVIIFSLALLIPIFIMFRRQPKAKPNTLSLMIYQISFSILVIVVMIYAIIIIQNLLTTSGIIPQQFSYNDLSTVHLVCITFIIVFGLIALPSWLVGRAGRKH